MATCLHANAPARVLVREDFTKIIQVGPNIQFIYRVNICANTLAKCSTSPDSPATEVRRRCEVYVHA